LEYIIEMQTVVETPSYLKAAEGIFSAEEREKIVAMVSADSRVRRHNTRHRRIQEGKGWP